MFEKLARCGNARTLHLCTEKMVEAGGASLFTDDRKMEDGRA
jgi:hypothetical protein